MANGVGPKIPAEAIMCANTKASTSGTCPPSASGPGNGHSIFRAKVDGRPDAMRGRFAPPPSLIVGAVDLTNMQNHAAMFRSLSLTFNSSSCNESGNKRTLAFHATECGHGTSLFCLMSLDDRYPAIWRSCLRPPVSDCSTLLALSTRTTEAFLMNRRPIIHGRCVLY